MRKGKKNYNRDFVHEDIQYNATVYFEHTVYRYIWKNTLGKKTSVRASTI